MTAHPRRTDDLAVLAGADMWHTPPSDGIPRIRMSDGPAGVRGTDWRGPASASFPCGTALAATFDPDLVREIGQALAREAHSKSVQVLLAPTVNLHRTPVGGRNFECMSEDPIHTAAIATAYVDGVQDGGVACCIKHLVGNDTEFARFVVSSEIPERVLRELYLVPFEAAVAAGVRSVMTGYNRLNGTYCSEHRWLLSDVLRGEWGFDGLVVSDWYGTHSTVEALEAGLDVEMPGPPIHRGERLRAAVTTGDVDESVIDEAVGRVRALAHWTGAAVAGTDEITADDPETRALCRRAAAAGTVLLANPDGLLPLDHGRRIALIGPHAASGRIQGGGSAKVNPHQPAELLPALVDRGFAVEHAPGCTIDKALPTLRGSFAMELSDVHGNTRTVNRRRLELVRQHHEDDGLEGAVSARISGTFEVDQSGPWLFGVRSVGPATVRVDGRDVVTVPADAVRGGSFFGFGSDEHIASIDLAADADHQIEVEYPPPPGDGMGGVIVGARLTAEPDLLGDAVALATDAEVAVVVVGTDDAWETEGEDRTTIALPGRQDELVEAVAAANPNTVVVVNAGSPVAMPWLDRVGAVLQIWFPGGQLGTALTDVLAGDVEPGGRLPVTFPRRLSDTPAAEHHPGDGVRAEYAEGLLIGHRWYDHQSIDPLFWFGHGLGYTTFDIAPVSVDGDPVGNVEGASGVTVVAEVTNTGHRPGTEVVQVYVRARVDHPDVDPILRFAGSRKVYAVPGERIATTVTITPRAFASWLDGGWRVPPGDYEVLVGRSAGELTLAGTRTVAG